MLEPNLILLTIDFSLKRLLSEKSMVKSVLKNRDDIFIDKIL